MSRLLHKIALSFLICGSLWLVGLFWFTSLIPKQPSTDATVTDAIVVLTGGSGRIEYGLQLLAEGRGKKLFISGVHEHNSVESLLHYVNPDIRAKLTPETASAVAIGHDAWNTIGNAEETARWLQTEHVQSLRLVTTNYHMPRSLQEFQETITGVTILPSPSFTDDFNINDWWAHEDSRILMLSEYHKFIASKCRHSILHLLHEL